MSALRGFWRLAEARRLRTPAGLFSQADRLRRDGRYVEAAQLVARGLTLAPESLTGHLLAAYLHAAQRAGEPARQEFQWVLARDPRHPRALLGLARLALEEGDLDACRDALARALRAYPDFPEAQALLDGLSARSPASASLGAALRLDRLRMPEAALALVVIGGDPALVSARPDGAAELGRRLARAAGLAAAALGRAGLGPLRRAVVEDADERHVVRADDTLTLALTLPRTAHLTQGLLEVNRLWAAVQHELAMAKDEDAGTAGVPRASVRRVS
ncbi:MAG TPA: tetratricopeptide repeat protein [Methylomirabilota bacterium]|nr:tetratricopeptide repeat protein [Methylomirabilota bacterium]